MIGPGDLVRALVDGGVIASVGVVDEDLQVREASRRNANFVVRLGDHSLFVKTPGTDGAWSSLATEREAARFLVESGLHECVPRFVASLPDDQGIVFEWEAEGTLFELFSRQRAPGRIIARRSAALLSRVHQLPHPEWAGDAGPPFPLLLPCPSVTLYESLSGSGRTLLAYLQGARGLAEGLERLAGDWRSDALIHRDVKWDNFLVRRVGRARRANRVLLADWELAGLGDPMWDVGSYLSEYLRAWLISFPVLDSFAPDLLLDRARFPLVRAHASARAFWEAYATERGGAGPRPDLSVCLRYVGARLVQTAFELTQRASRLGGLEVLMLQLADNIMARPMEAAQTLFGIDSGS